MLRRALCPARISGLRASELPCRSQVLPSQPSSGLFIVAAVEGRTVQCVTSAGLSEVACVMAAPQAPKALPLSWAYIKSWLSFGRMQMA